MDRRVRPDDHHRLAVPGAAPHDRHLPQLAVSREEPEPVISETNGVVREGGPVRRSRAAVAGLRTAAGRLTGLDAARGLALLGMLAAHTVPEGDGDFVWDGRSSILFATIAGVSLGLMSGGSRRPAPDARARVARVVLLRGLLLIVLGVLLTFLETPIAIILDTYGFLFIVALPLLYAPRWLVALVAAGAALAGPWLVETIGTAIEGTTGATATAFDSPWAYFPVRWLIDAYPAPVWLAYLAVGILIARSDLRKRRTQYVLVAAGGLAAVLGYTLPDALGSPVLAHDDTTAEVIASGGLAVAVIGLLVWLTDSAAAGVRRVSRGVLWPLRAVGSMPLTIYTAQIIGIAVAVEVIPHEEWLGWQSVPLFFVFAIPSLVLACLWKLVFTQGPLEWVFSRLTTHRPWPRRRKSPSGDPAGA